MKALIRNRPYDDEEAGVLGRSDGSGDEERVAFLTTVTSTRINRRGKSTTSFHPSSKRSASDDSSSTISTVDYSDILDADDEERKASHGQRVCWSFRVVLSLSMLCVVTITIFLCMIPSSPSTSSSSSSSSSSHNEDQDESSRNNSNSNNSGRIEYECPTSVGPTVGDSAESFEKEYTSVTRQITNNITKFKETFRTVEFDGWGRSYETVKKGMYAFKSKYYPLHLMNGSSIYESACGIGLNLLMTLEILEEHGIRDVIMYGNEYVPESADKANWMLSEINPPGNAQVGKICPGDSSNLSFVPSNTMDLVYTGYITPLMDPLHFNAGNEEYKEYDDICDMVKSNRTTSESDSQSLTSGSGYDWMAMKLNEVIQLEQERWYGQWVAEMTRIAKPGSPVLIEQVSPSYCTKTTDWGGVDKEYWNRSATLNTYGWNVDPSSLQLVDDRLFRKRYNVFMMTRK